MRSESSIRPGRTRRDLRMTKFSQRRWIEMMSELGYGSDALDQIFLLGFVFGADGEGVEEPQA